MSNTKMAIFGGGSIGIAFAVVFLREGNDVAIYEPSAERRSLILDEVCARAEQLSAAGLASLTEEQVQVHLSVGEDLSEVLRGADLVQECIPEQLELKRDLFRQIAEHVDQDVIVASSSSAITASKSMEDTGLIEQGLVAHPGNPPYLLPVIEIVPTPTTNKALVERAIEIYASCGLEPVLIKVEQEGFVFNRLQGALLREAYALVRDGVIGANDLDKVVRDGLGRRWAFMGPFEVADVNTRGGIVKHAERLGPAYLRMGQERGQNDPWEPDLVSRVEAERREVMPLDKWEERVAWRDSALLELEKLKQTLEGKG